jgi:hypothetical protein
MRTFGWATLATVLLSAAGSVGSADRSPPLITFAIGSQPLTTALNEFARQAHIQVLRRDEEVSLDGLVAPQVEGRLSAEEALKRILSRTGLSYEFVNDRTVRIAKTAASDPS